MNAEAITNFEYFFLGMTHSFSTKNCQRIFIKVISRSLNFKNKICRSYLYMIFLLIPSNCFADRFTEAVYRCIKNACFIHNLSCLAMWCQWFCYVTITVHFLKELINSWVLSIQELICNFEDNLHDRGCKLKHRSNRLHNWLYSRQGLIRIRRNLVDCEEIQDSQSDLDDQKAFANLLAYKQSTGKSSCRYHHISHSLLLALK